MVTVESVRDDGDRYRMDVAVTTPKEVVRKRTDVFYELQEELIDAVEDLSPEDIRADDDWYYLGVRVEINPCADEG